MTHPPDSLGEEKRPEERGGIPDPPAPSGQLSEGGPVSLPGSPSPPPAKVKKLRGPRGAYRPRLKKLQVQLKHCMVPDSEGKQPKRNHSDGVPGGAIEIGYEPHAKQSLIREAVEAGCKIIMFRAGIRSGKSFSFAHECLSLIYKDKRLPNLGYILAPTINMTRVPRRLFVEAAGDALIRYKRASDDGPPHALLIAPPGLGVKHYVVEFHSGEYADRMRGASVGWAWIDEAAYTKPEVYDVVLGRLMDSGGILFISTSPSTLSHWTETEVATHAARCGRCGQGIYDHKWRREGLKLVYNDHEPENVTGDPKIAIIQCTTYDNTFIPEENIRELEARYALKDPVIRRRELYGEPCGFEGLIYRSFTRQDHRSNIGPHNVPTGSTIVAGVDFGVNDPFVAVFLARVGDVWHVADEYYYAGPPRSIAEHVAAIKARCPLWNKVKKWWYDPSGKQQSIEMSRAGIKPLLSARRRFAKGKDWIMARIEAVTSLQLAKSAIDGGPQFRVFPKCANTIRELETRQWKRYKVEGEDGRVRIMDRKGKEADRNAGEEPAPGNDHTTDCIEYAIYSELVTGRYKVEKVDPSLVSPPMSDVAAYEKSQQPHMAGLSNWLADSMAQHAKKIQKPEKRQAWSWGPGWQ